MSNNSKFSCLLAHHYQILKFNSNLLFPSNLLITVNPRLEVDLVLFQIQNSIDLYQRYFKMLNFQSKNFYWGDRGFLGSPKNVKKGIILMFSWAVLAYNVRPLIEQTSIRGLLLIAVAAFHQLIFHCYYRVVVSNLNPRVPLHNTGITKERFSLAILHKILKFNRCQAPILMMVLAL